MTDAQTTAHATSALLEASAILLGAGLIFVLLFRKLKLGATLGYIVGGSVIGPYALGWIEDPERLSGLTEIGIALLLFIVGLELDPGRLWRLRKNIFGLGLAQVVLGGLALSGFIKLVFDPSWEASLAIGLPLALSSTAQVLPMLRSSGLLNTPGGERAFSILLFQDLSIVPLITIVAALSRINPDPSAPTGLKLALYTVAAVVGLVVAGRLLLGPLFRLIGRIADQELFVFAGLFVVVGVSALMHFFGLSVALGAFVAGVMLAESPYRHELESDIEPFRSLLLGMFFLSVGMLLDLTVIANRPLTVIGIALGVVAIKAGVLMLLGRAFRVRAVRPGRCGAIAERRIGVDVQRGGGTVDGDDPFPDAADRFSRSPGRKANRPRGSREIARNAGHRRRLRPLRPDRRTDADGQTDRGDDRRPRRRNDRGRQRIRVEGLLWRRHPRRPAAHRRRGRGAGDPVLQRRRQPQSRRA